MNIIIGIIEQGLLYGIVALGVYITYKILDFPDLSVDGTLTLGAAITAMCLMKGVNPFVACIFALLGGCIGGAITGALHVKLKITNLMSGILVMIGLYSINLRIMTKANVPLFNKESIFSGSVKPIIVIVIFAIVVKLLLDLFLKTKLGFILKAVGDNEQLVTSLSVNKDTIKVIGLMISNGVVALAGAMMAQQQGFADIGMGTGTVVMGLAAVILGESIFGRLNIMQATTAAMLGSIIYRAAVAGTLELGLDPNDLKLITAVIVVVALSLNNKKFSFNIKKKSYSGGDTVAADSESI